MALLKEALKSLRIEGLEQSLEQHPVPYDPAGNGMAEVGVQLVKGRLTTCKRSLEIRVRHRTPPTAPIVAWLVAHAIFVWTVRQKQAGTGRTSYAHVKGREFSTRLLEFGECCHFRLNEHEAGMGYRVRQGVFLGHDRLNGRYLVHAEGKVHCVRTVTRLPNAMKWNMQLLQDVRVMPWDLHKPRNEGVVFW